MSTSTSIIDNQGDNTLQVAIEKITGGGKDLCIATAFFSLDALGLIARNLNECERIRILFGDDAAQTQRIKLLKRLRIDSDRALGEERMSDPDLSTLRVVDKLFREGRIEARCYTAKKFHAKAYTSHLATPQGPYNAYGILGSGNFTRPGLTQNLELNVHLSTEQTEALQRWFEERWAEAIEDDVTDKVQEEIKRQLDLYDPFAIYQRSLIAWGDYYQGRIGIGEGLRLFDVLDPHQMLGYQRAVEILEREHGVMICDGVGLGKSFIALALMEHFCRLKKNVLLIAPKNIMASSWNAYLEEYLVDFRRPFGTIDEKYMSDLQFDPEEDVGEDNQLTDKQANLRKYIERADVIVIDESHNFRKTHVNRYINLRMVTHSLSSASDARKKVIMLTATPINTHYQDISAQLALISQENGTLGGYDTKQINESAKKSDTEAKKQEAQQLTLSFDQFIQNHDVILSKVLEAVVIQRKRSTCIELAKSAGKELVFPIRETPYTIEYTLSTAWREVVELAGKRFRPTAALLKQMRQDQKKAREQNIELKPFKMPARMDGIKFAAFLPEAYRMTGSVAARNYQYEVYLAGLVFVNTMKQLESSPAAFQGILQSLGISLAARLRYVFGDLAVNDIAPHLEWIRKPLNAPVVEETDSDNDPEEGEDNELNGEELDIWIEHAISSRHLHRKLADFTAEEFDRARWHKDLLNDLRYLKEIHADTLKARHSPDFKLEVMKNLLKERLDKHQRVVVFTQSQRTSFYLEKALIEHFPEAGVARIDSNVQQDTRAHILYAFCPNYNTKPNKGTLRDRVDILICTDVLSEGVNMQEAECILNYDIHWNPVRLIQRIGRVDRRLDLTKTPVPHSFSILNCIPPKEIDDIIALVDTVEDRTTRISRTLGLDQAFFKSTDPAGTLREFNLMVDGAPTATDRANASYVGAITNPDPDIMAAVKEMPPGAYGVWHDAPVDGVFALFEMKEDEKNPLSETDREFYRSTLGMPVLALDTGSEPNLNAAEILEVLSHTIKGVRSGAPGDPAAIRDALKRMKSAINKSFRKINLVASVQPKLVCFLEMRRK